MLALSLRRAQAAKVWWIETIVESQVGSTEGSLQVDICCVSVFLLAVEGGEFVGTMMLWIGQQRDCGQEQSLGHRRSDLVIKEVVTGSEHGHEFRISTQLVSHRRSLR